MKRILALLALFMSSSIVSGADMSHGANNFYISSRVHTQKVAFKNQYGLTVAGSLFVPKGMNRSVRHAALVIGHPMGAVKEQSANLYATKMADRGFVALAIDLSYWGESEGLPRNTVSPDMYTEDFSAAVDFLRSQAFVDKDAVGAIGICGSGSFVISAAAQPRSIHASRRSPRSACTTWARRAAMVCDTPCQ